MSRFLLAALLLLSVSASAQTFPFAGALDDGDGVADGLFTFELALLDADDDVLWTEEQANVVVVGGVFAIDVGASAPLPTSIPGRARLEITVDGDALPAVPLARFLSVTRAAVAGRAASATTTTLLAGNGAADVATREALAAAGGPAVAFANIAGVPASVANGDQGTDVTSTGGDFAISARTLSLATVSGGRIAPNAVTAAVVTTGSVTTAQVAEGAVTGAKLQDGTMTRSRFEADVTTREVKTRAISMNLAGCQQPGELTDGGSCFRRACTTGGGLAGVVGCNGTGCDFSTVSNQTCLLINSVGRMVIE